MSDPEVQMFGLQRMWCLESECELFNVAAARFIIPFSGALKMAA
jgi:hypothetical protein